MNCDESKSMLSAYHDQELSPTLRAQLQDHLQGCAACRNELKIIQQISSLAEPIRTAPITPVKWSIIAEQLTPAQLDAKPRRFAMASNRRLLWSIAAVFSCRHHIRSGQQLGGKK